MSLRIFELVAFVILILLLSACDSPTPSLLETQWKWSTIITGIAQVMEENLEKFIQVFHEDGTFNGQVDCDIISGTYEMEQDKLNLSISPATMQECGTSLQYEGFMGFLKYVDLYELEDSSLTLFLSDGSTRLGFKNGGLME